MCKNINNTHKEALNSPEFVGLLTVQSEVLRVLMALVVPKSKNFHLDLTSRLYPWHQGGGGGANIAQNLRKILK